MDLFASGADRDPRYCILADDGRFVTLGRAAPPSDEEVAKSGAALAQHGLQGWLVQMGDSFYRSIPPSLRMLRAVAGAPDAKAWQAAVIAFRAAHAASLRPLRKRAAR